jgi:type I restriction enzyme, S subunit
MSWREVALRDCAIFLSGGTPSKRNAEYWNGDIPWVSSGEMTRQFIDDTSLHITETAALTGSRLVPEGTIFAVVRGMSLATEIRVSYATRRMAFNQDLKGLLVKEGVDPYFLFSSLRANADQICDLATEAAHGTKKLEMERLESFQIKVPNITRQQKIADVVRNYDDLIETNCRRIDLLEESARLLYREWFVNLRFPGYETVKFDSGVPLGWRLIPISSAADFINGYAFKPIQLKDWGLPVVKIPELRDGVSDKTPKNSGDGIPERNKIDTGDLLFSWSATLLVNEWSDGPALLNQHLFKVKPRAGFQKRYIRFALETAIPSLLGQSVGATMQHIRKSALENHSIFVPSEEVCNAFSEVIDPVCDQIITLKQQVKQLTCARDELLPKLMSGAIQA